jgi:cyclopropane fatty-acyl-phospholipid synthase-like methyltransferase
MAGTLVRSKSPLQRGKTLSAAKPGAAPAATPASALKPEAHAKDDGYIPFKIRFQAWWEGVEPSAIVRKGQKARNVAPQRVIELDAEADLLPETEPGAARIRICDRVWGEGFTGPGGADYGLEHATPFSRGRSSTALDLTAGLGGRVADIARDKDVTVTGYDRDEEFVDHAQQRAARAELPNVKPITVYNPERLNLQGLRYDTIVARDLFYTVPDKLALMGALRNGLRQGGILAFTDFALAEFDQNEGAVMEQWQATEPYRPHPWSIDEYQECFEALDFDVVNVEDDTANYRNLVVGAWQDFAGNLDSSGLDRAFVDTLVPEAELWLHRMRALECGQLCLLKVTLRSNRAD